MGRLRRELVAVIDSRTTVICLDAAGQIVGAHEPFHTLVGDQWDPPFHVHCRSIVDVVVDEDVSLSLQQAARTELMTRPASQFKKLPPMPKQSLVTKLRDRVRSLLYTDRGAIDLNPSASQRQALADLGEKVKAVPKEGASVELVLPGSRFPAVVEFRGGKWVDPDWEPLDADWQKRAMAAWKTPSDPFGLPLPTAGPVPTVGKAANPSYGSDPLASVNCQKSVFAWELRQRGYRVVATPGRPTGAGLGGRTALESWFAGDDVRVVMVAGDDFDAPASIMGGVIAKTIRRQKDWILNPGTRGVLHVKWRGEELAHVVTWEVPSPGKIRFFDPQDGSEWLEGSPVWRKVDPTYTRMWRIDDQPLSGKGMDSVVPE